MDDTQNPTIAATGSPGAAAEGAGDDDLSGRTIGEFEILRRLGRGGMGQVFLAQQQSLKRKVAIKILRPELAANPNAVKRFRAEAEAVAALTHANIVQVYAIGEHEGVPYMALEYIEGRNLRDFLNRKGPPDLPIALSIMRQVGSALQKAGEQDFVHRDIKPENILLSFGKVKDKDGKILTKLNAVKVADFGLSRCLTETQQPLNLTQSGVAMGTPLYMSPEQVQGKPVDPRSDMYSFGVTCFHMLAGQPPFRGSSAFDVAVKHVQNEPPALSSFRPDLPPELCTLIHKMMAKRPDDRYQTAKDFLRELAILRGSISGLATGQSAGPPPSDVFLPSTIPTVGVAVTSEFAGMKSDTPRKRSYPWWLLAAAVVGLFGVVLGGVTVRYAANKLLAKSPEKTQPAVEPPVVPVVSDDEHFALNAAKQFADPLNRDDLRKGLGFQIDLFVYYMKQHRLDDADKFLNTLQGNSYKRIDGFTEHPYQIFARFGHGIVLAFRDKAKESMESLAKLLPAGQSPPGLRLTGLPSGFGIDHFELRHLLADALNRNAKNLRQEKFSDTGTALESLRKPPEIGRSYRPSFGKESPKKPG